MADVEVTATGDVTSLLDSMDKAGKAGGKMADDLKSAGEKGSAGFGEGVTKIVEGAKKIVEGFLAFEAVKKGFEFGKQLVEAASDAQIAGAQTQAVLKSTGEAAGLNEAAVDKLTNSLAEHNGVTEESARAGVNMLLTFRDVRNEVGKGNDIFNQASQATEDMARAMGMSGRDSALQLGKALNDPAQGMSRLQRIGVTFTDSQKNAAKAMEAAGNTAGAQKIVLAELNKEFGGSGAKYADTYAGKLQAMKDAGHELEVQLGSKLLPVLTGLAGAATKGLDWLNKTGAIDKIGKAFDTFGGYLKPLRPMFTAAEKEVGPFIDRLGKELQPTISALLPALLKFGMAGSPMLAIFKALQPVLPLVAGLLLTLVKTIGGVLTPILAALTPVLTRVTGVFSGLLTQALQTLLPVIIQLVDQLGPVLTTVVTALTPVITLLGTILSTVLGAAFKIISPLIGVVADLLKTLIPVVLPIIELVAKLAGQLATALMPLFNQLAKLILPLVTQTFNMLLPVLEPVIKVLGTTLTQVIKDLLPVITTVFKAIVPIIKDAVTIITGVVDVFSGLLSGNWDKVWNGLGKIVSGALGAVFDIIKGAGMVFESAVTGLLKAGLDVLKGAIDTVITIGTNIVGGLVKGIKNNAADVGKTLMDMVSGGVKAVEHFLGIASPSKYFQKIGEFVNQGLVKGVNGTADQVTSAMQGLANRVTSAFSQIVSARTADQKRLATLDKELANTSTVKEAGRKRAAALEDQISAEKKAISGLSSLPSKSQRSAFTTLLDSDTTKLTALAKKRDQITADLSTAQDALNQVLSDKASYGSNVSSGVVDAGNVATAYANAVQAAADAATAADGATAAATSQSPVDTLLSNLKQQVAQANQFNSVLATLKGEGIDTTTYGQLVDAGSTNGLAAANALAAQGPAAIKQIADLQGQLKTAGDTLGSSTADTMYAAGQQAAQATVDGIKSKLADANGAMGLLEAQVGEAAKKLGIDSKAELANAGSDIVAGLASGITGKTSLMQKTMSDLGKSTVAALKKELGIKSPSTVMDQQVGQMIGEGVIQGVKKKTADVNAAVGGLVAVPHAVSGATTPAGGGSGGYGAPSGDSGAGAGTQVTHNWTINVPAKADRDDVQYAEDLMRQVRFAVGAAPGGTGA